MSHLHRIIHRTYLKEEADVLQAKLKEAGLDVLRMEQVPRFGNESNRLKLTTEYLLWALDSELEQALELLHAHWLKEVESTSPTHKAFLLSTEDIDTILKSPFLYDKYHYFLCVKAGNKKLMDIDIAKIAQYFRGAQRQAFIKTMPSEAQVLFMSVISFLGAGPWAVLSGLIGSYGKAKTLFGQSYHLLGTVPRSESFRILKLGAIGTIVDTAIILLIRLL